MKVVDYINALSQHPGNEEVESLEEDGDKVFVNVSKKKPKEPKKPKKPKAEK